MTLKVFSLKKFVSVSLMLWLTVGFVGNIVPQAHSSERLVKQAVLLIKQSTQTADSWTYAYDVSVAMNISATILHSDSQNVTEAVLYDGDIGRFSLIFVTAISMETDLDGTELTLLDAYEEKFGVAEGLLGQVTTVVGPRYGVSALGATQRFYTCKWVSNGLTNFMNTSMKVTTPDNGMQVYAYGGNTTQTNPILWSYVSGNKTRIASSIGGLDPWIGQTWSFWGVFWLTAKLSSANKILKFYFSFDIDDVQIKYSDNGTYGAPPVTNLYFNGSDVEYMYNNLLSTQNFTPTLVIDYSDLSTRYNMTTEYPALRQSLTTYQDYFDFIGHNHRIAMSTYEEALEYMNSDLNAIRRWGFLPTIYYSVPGGHNYSITTAQAISDSPTWYVAQRYAGSGTDLPPQIVKKLGAFDSWAPSLFRVARKSIDFLDYNLRSKAQILNRSGLGSWSKYWRRILEQSWYGPKYLGGYRIFYTHFPNFVADRESADAPAVHIIKNATTIGIVPIVPSRSWAIAENIYTVKNFQLEPVYNIDADTLTYTLIKSNSTARDRITLIFEDTVQPVDFNPLILKYDLGSTIVTLNYQSSITFRLSQRETAKPYVVNYQTSLLTQASFSNDTLILTLFAPSEMVSTTNVYVGDKGRPVTVSGASLSWAFNTETKIVTINAFPDGLKEITLDWIDHDSPITAINLGGVQGDNSWFISDVIANLTATDNFSGVDTTEYSFNRSTWITYTTPFTVSSEGNTIIYYNSTDVDGNVETVKSKTVKIDKTIPSGTLIINNGVEYTTLIFVTLTITATDATSGVNGVRFSNDGVWDTIPWENLDASKTWKLPSEDGTKTVYCQIKDNAGLIATCSDTITLDTFPPIGNITIAEGAKHTNSSSVILTLSANDTTSGVAQMRFSNDNVNWTSWEPYATSKAWALTANNGTKTVFVQFMDNAGLFSGRYLYSIRLDIIGIEENGGENFPLWALGAAVAAIGITAAIAVLNRKKKH